MTKEKKKRYILIVVIIFVSFLIGKIGANSINQESDKRLESYQQQQNQIDSDLVDLYMKSCGKTTPCHGDDISNYKKANQ